MKYFHILKVSLGTRAVSRTLERVLGSVVSGTLINTVQCRPQGKDTANIHERTEQPYGGLYLWRLTVGAERSWSQLPADGSPPWGDGTNYSYPEQLCRQNFRVVASFCFITYFHNH